MTEPLDTVLGRLGSDQNVVRYVGGAHFDPNTGTVNAGAFERQPKDTDGLSFTQTRKLAADPDEDEYAIRAVVGSRLKLGRTAHFAELNVGCALDTLAEFDVPFSFVENALEATDIFLANPAHALLLGLPFKDQPIGSLRSELAGDRLALTIARTFPAVV